MLLGVVWVVVVVASAATEVGRMDCVDTVVVAVASLLLSVPVMECRKCGYGDSGGSCVRSFFVGGSPSRPLIAPEISRERTPVFASRVTVANE